MSEDLDWEEWNPNKISLFHHIVAGSLAGLAEHLSVFPIDTIKTKVQCEKCGSTSLFQTWNCASKMIKKEGPMRLWRGVTATFAGCVPAHAAYFTIYENVKVISGANSSGHHPFSAALSGASAAVGHDLFMNPFDVVKQQMQLGYHKNAYKCIEYILRNDGIVGLYVSLPTTLVMNIPHACVQVAINESCRKLLDPTGKYSVETFLISGSIAGAVAALFTNPLDVIKTRLQTQNLDICPRIAKGNVLTSYVTYSSNKSLLGAKDIILNVLKYEGVFGFYKGTFARMMTQAPGCAVSWTVYELVKKALSNQ